MKDDAASWRGVGAGDRVAIMMTNRPELLETVFAANALGAIAVPVNFRLSPAEITFILTDSGARLLVVDAANGPVAATARAACARPIGFLSVGDTAGADPYVPASAPPQEPPAVDVPEDSPAVIMYTSGTTGRPKGAVLSLARYKLPTSLHVVAALPRNASGKVMKTLLRDQFTGG